MTEAAAMKNCLIVPTTGSGTIETIKSSPETGRDNSRNSNETISLKALANRHLPRDKARDISETNKREGAAPIASCPPFVSSRDGTVKPPAPCECPEDAIERAAIQAEDTPARRLRKRDVSWSRSDDAPAPGDYCACCSGSLWWTETAVSSGWRCCQCHPSAHLQAAQLTVVAT
jgi:hypothetical protein